tara:strand:- start:459 stop:908 length:450 start_codon:yes stop_codon:yes gene_type:complete
MILGVCEIYTPVIHGHTEYSSKNILGNYIVIDTIELSEFYNNEHLRLLHNLRKMWRSLESLAVPTNPFQHPLIRDLQTISKTPNFISVDILDTYELEGGEIIGIKKTFWLKIFQRKCKKYLMELRLNISRRGNPKAIFHKKVTGQWPTQ